MQSLQSACCLELQPFVDDIVKYVDESVIQQFVAHLVKLELKSGESFRDIHTQWMRLLLIILEG
jgi:hypothetical protein